MSTALFPRSMSAGLALLLAMTLLVPTTARLGAQEETPPNPTTSPDLLPSGAMPLPHSAEAFRNHFDLMLQEHTYLAGATTHALVNDRREEFLAAQSMLQANSVAISRVIGALYGPVNEARFLQGWRRHVQDYELWGFYSSA